MKLKYLNQLADIVVSVDEGKNITDASVVSMTDQGIRLIEQMKLLGLEVGALQETFAGMQLMCGDRAMLTPQLKVCCSTITETSGSTVMIFWRLIIRAPCLAPV